MNGTYLNDTEEEYECEEEIGSRTWFNVKVVVEENNDTASLYINGQLKTSDLPMKFPKHIGGGIMVLNGFHNIISFRDVTVSPDPGTLYSSSKCKKCVKKGHVY